MALFEKGVLVHGGVIPGGQHRTYRQRHVITSAQLLALNDTAQILVAAPGAGLMLIFEGAVIQKPAGTAYGGIAAGEDLSVKYTDKNGLEVGRCETTGFLDSTANQIRYLNGHRAASGISSFVPVANAALVLHLLVGEISTGDSDLNIETHFRVVNAAP